MEKPAGLPTFSLSAFLLAPWPLPLVSSALMVFGGGPTRQPVAAFFLFLALGLVISYLGTAALVISLWFIARIRPVTRLLSMLTGVGLAAIAYLPFLYLSWSSSGPDSGPPIESFATYFVRNLSDPFLSIFLAGGLIAALTYDILARRAGSRPADVSRPA